MTLDLAAESRALATDLGAPDQHRFLHFVVDRACRQIGTRVDPSRVSEGTLWLYLQSAADEWQSWMREAVQQADSGGPNDPTEAVMRVLYDRYRSGAGVGS